MRLSSPVLASAFAKTHHARLIGEDQHFHGANEIHHVQPGDLTFVDHPKYYRSTINSAASVILINKVPKDIELPSGKTLLVTDQPFAAYNALVKQERPTYSLKERIARSAHVHASAIIEPGAIIGPKVSIGAYTVVQANAVIYGPARIGKHCLIGAGTVIGDRAFYFHGNAVTGRQRWATGGEVIIEDEVEIGPNCNIARGVSAPTTIGSGTKIDAQVMIAHDCRIGQHCLIAAQAGLAGNVTVEDRVVIYGQAGIAQNVTIAAGTIVLAKTGIFQDTAANDRLMGYPGQPARKWMKEQAMLRRMT
jgi:UDP-3-O-[3-hydroxymyristoyl] glucosamine N-acyltransferase